MINWCTLKIWMAFFSDLCRLQKKTQKQHKILTTTTTNVAPNGSRQGSSTNQPASQPVVGCWKVAMRWWRSKGGGKEWWRWECVLQLIYTNLWIHAILNRFPTFLFYRKFCNYDFSTNIEHHTLWFAFNSEPYKIHFAFLIMSVIRDTLFIYPPNPFIYFVIYPNKKAFSFYNFIIYAFWYIPFAI